MFGVIVYRIKVMLLGELNSKKSRLAEAYLKKVGANWKISGVNSYVHQDTIEDPVFGKVHVELLVWDISPLPEFESVRHLHYRGAKAAIAVFNLAIPETFNKLQNWINEFWRYSGGTHPVVIVGHGVDPSVGERVPLEYGKKYAEKLSEIVGIEVPYIEFWGDEFTAKEIFLSVVQMVLKFDKMKLLRRKTKSGIV